MLIYRCVLCLAKGFIVLNSLAIYFLHTKSCIVDIPTTAEVLENYKLVANSSFRLVFLLNVNSQYFSVRANDGEREGDRAIKP